jgi:hypothetical protein
MKKIIIVLPSIIILFAFLNISTGLNNNANALPGYCPPICLDEVNQHVNGAIKALDKADIFKAQSELNIVKSLLDQLKDMTTTSTK